MALKHVCGGNPGSTEREKGDFFDFLDFRNARISPKDEDGCPMSPQVFAGNEDDSSNFRKNETTPPLPGRLPIACSIKAPAGNCPVLERRTKKRVLEFSNDSHQAVHFPGTSEWHCPALLHKKYFKLCGKYFTWKSKACCKGLKRIFLLFRPLFKLLFISLCINAHN